ncbi:XPG domain containing-domain-containing protein [Hypoxylon crocopeplum]|nr:XPG domain containing-domain-containing protein [Hypoxylon crocopeplum]
MGIRGFGQAVQRYGVFAPLSGDSVVIDGPALVHRISEACMKQRPSGSGFVCHPAYSLLSQMVIGWLNELKNHNVNVRKIYFDGYLPPVKWDVRRDRLLNQSQHMKSLVSSQPFGSTRMPEGAFDNLKADLTLTRLVSRSSTDTLPKAPFLVPAVLEALKHSEDWGPLVIVVPGEADMYCAQDIRENGGTLLTSDSDLLIQDLGPNGCVSFFWDVVPADPTCKELGVMACKLSLHDINDRLGLTNIGGLPRVAFENQRGRMKFNTALQKARDSHEDTLNSSEYQTFMKELELKEYVPSDHPVHGILSSMDPRVSEVVIQALLLEKEADSSTLSAKTSRGPETLSIFLPIVVENRDKRSVWTASTNIRQIAYSVLHDSMRQKSSTIIEYRTLDSSTSLTGRQVEIPDIDETISDCRQLITVLEKLSKGLPSLDMQWLAFAVYQDIERSVSEQRPSLSAALVNKIMSQSEDAEEYSWDLIHFTGQVQACLYSLRIEKQILDVVLFLGESLPPAAQQLRDYLASLPLIEEWPIVERMFGLLSDFGNTNGLSLITDMLGIPRIKAVDLSLDTTGSTKRRKRDHEQLSREIRQTGAKRSPSINPYAILSQASQD